MFPVAIYVTLAPEQSVLWNMGPFFNLPIKIKERMIERREGREEEREGGREGR